MHSGQRVFYTSENGDRWLLQSGDDIVTVRHLPNAASGGQSSTTEIGAFLIQERHSAQNQALRALIASLTRTEDVPVNADANPVVTDTGVPDDVPGNANSQDFDDTTVAAERGEDDSGGSVNPSPMNPAFP